LKSFTPQQKPQNANLFNEDDIIGNFDGQQTYGSTGSMQIPQLIEGDLVEVFQHQAQ
jgi:hypothetical protein